MVVPAPTTQRMGVVTASTQEETMRRVVAGEIIMQNLCVDILPMRLWDERRFFMNSCLYYVVCRLQIQTQGRINAEPYATLSLVLRDTSLR